MKTEELNEQFFLISCIEYLKANNTTKNSEEIQKILRRSCVTFLKTKEFRGGKVWNQKKLNINLSVPIPILENAQKLNESIDRVFAAVCPEDNDYGFGNLYIKPKLIGSADINYKEHDVLFQNIKKTIIQGIRDARYVIWIAVAWFSDRDIYNELCLRKNDGLNIRVITIGNKTNKTLLEELYQTFDAVKITLPGSHIFHHKFCIIDFDYVMHGSYNWSTNAEGNEETWSTALDRDYARKFADKFMRMYKDYYVDPEDLIIVDEMK